MNPRKCLLFALMLLLVGSNLFSQEFTTQSKPHSAKRATLYSAILPGMGQVYNKQTWKLPVIYSLGAATAYLAISNYQNSIKFKDEYYNRLNGNTSELLADYATYSNESILALHQAYDKNFQLGIMLSAAVYLLNIVDAMVYGHLFDFNINDDLSATLTPFTYPCFAGVAPNIGMTLSIKIK